MAFEIPFARYFSKKNEDLPAPAAIEPPPQAEPIAPAAEFTAAEFTADYKDAMAFSSAAALTELNAKEKTKEIKLPFIGHRTRLWQERFLMTVLFFAISFGIVFALLHWQRTYLTNYQTRLTTEMQQHFQQMTSSAAEATMARPSALNQLDNSYEFIKRNWATLQALHRGATTAGAEETGGGRSAYEATPELLNAAYKVEKIWGSSEPLIRSVMSMKDELTALSSAMQKVNNISGAAPKLVEQIATEITKGNASSRETSAANQLLALAPRLARGKGELLTNDGINTELAASLSKDISNARSVTEGFLIGGLSDSNPGLHANLAKLQDLLSQYQQAIGSVIGNQQNVMAAKKAQQLLQAVNGPMKDSLSEMKNIYFEDLQVLYWPFWAMLLSIVITLVALASFMIVQIQGGIIEAQEAEKRRQEAEQQRLEATRLEEEARELNERNQAAILRLMNELQEVADGDLTIQATVSEDITGAIADSINYTVEELRELVGRVTNTAQQVNSASEEAAKISSELIGASQQQSREIEDATQLVLQMASDINNVSQSANESAEVARQSLMVAAQGAAAVENTIKGMNEIRDQIQETAKRIKRLGESSQEIGEITELISDITEQTNVLALNAAIQAASAGEAGRGFSVVAEEVQRLAERSAEATKQIGALVRTIQTDTHDAVAAMENSTQGVVEGAKLSDAAGAALADISRVSNQLADLIQSISSVTEKHAASANGLAQNIQHILGITEQTQQGTEQTAGSIQQLSSLAEELRNSVARFRVSAG